MSSTYWYEKHPDILDGEKAAMAQFFPQFKLERLTDGRLYWVGSVNPRGAAGGVWTLQAIYNHDHPNNRNLFGSSVRVYSIAPDLNELADAIGQALPHVLRDSENKLYMCTARQADVSPGRIKNSSSYDITSAAQSLGWAVKWIWLVESWLAGEISSSDIYEHVY